MILLYVLFGILPFLAAYVIIFQSTNRNMVEQMRQSEIRKLAAQAEQITGSIDLATELSERLYYDNEQEKITLKRYSNTEDMVVDYREFDLLSEYIKTYYRDIMSICIYLDTDRRVDNLYFKKLTDAIRQRPWYISTVKMQGQPCWTYLTNTMTTHRGLRLTRTMYTQDRTEVGILSIALKAELTEDFIMEQDHYAVMIHNGTSKVHANFDITADEMEEIMATAHTREENLWVNFRGERCMLNFSSIRPRYSFDEYTIVTLIPYNDIVSQARGDALVSITPAIIATVIMIIAIGVLNDWFNGRLLALKNAMHYVVENKEAADNTAVEVAGIGDARDEIWEIYRDLNYMVREMQTLTETANRERLQKEQLHSRQRDVEFKMLAAQINPHFLYNTLETIRMLALIDQEKEIADISVMLTKLLRGSLDAGQELRTLAWEMDLVECYIRIQSYRFGDRIVAEVIYDKEECARYVTLPLIVQPFVENAYVHAMEDMESGGKIVVRVRIDEAESLVRLYIEDNGAGMSREKQEDVNRNLNDFENLDRSHIGIANVNQRIKLRFGEAYGVTLESGQNKGTKVEILLPLIREENI